MEYKNYIMSFHNKFEQCKSESHKQYNNYAFIYYAVYVYINYIL